MYQVILIDDENIIVEGLRRVVKWADYDCEVIATASNGEEGAELIRKLHPDILFTDIRMPGKDGLTMVAGIRSEFPDMQITVLTGYRDFSYAQEAINLGVTRFLLKPSKMNEINEALETMTEKLKLLSPKSQEKGDSELVYENEHSNNAGSFIVNQAISFMRSAYREKLTLQDVANQCYVSQWHLSKLLNKYAEKSFYDILNEIRVEKAKELLEDPKLRIGDISEQVGYADTAHFAKIFKKLVGISANEYRNSL